MNKEFTSNELFEELNHISDDDKKWALLLWVYICSGKEGINKIIEFIEKEKNKVLLIDKQRKEDEGK